MMELVCKVGGVVCLCFSLTGFASIKKDDFIFLQQPYYSDIVCDQPAINASYTIKNNEDNPILLTYINLTTNDPFPEDFITVDKGPLTSCQVGSNVPGGGICNINLLITPVKCSAETFSAEVNRLLHIGINTWEKELTSDLIAFNYTIGPNPPVPPAEAFALLGQQVDNLGSPSSIIGSVGHTGINPITGSYQISDGTFYESSTDPNVITANNAFQLMYSNFINTMTGCRSRADLDWGDVIQSSYYCLTSNSGESYVSVDGLITLSGPGTFVFFVDSVPSTCFAKKEITVAPCDLRIGSQTHFMYVNGASPDNVFWIVGPGHNVFLTSGAALDGTVLAGGNISSDPTGPNPSTVLGQLWSLQTITLYGDTIAIHF